MTHDSRAEQLSHWLSQQLTMPFQLQAVSGDASFRRYFRVQTVVGSLIAVDAPPDKEDSHPFVALARSWLAQGIPVPEVRQVNFESGFMLLTDFGDQLLLPLLDQQSVAGFYQQAFDLLHQIQAVEQVEGYTLPAYDRDRLLTEMNLFPQWCLQARLDMTLNQEEQALLAQTFELLVDNALQQPQVCVHRDYHSRNLMVLPSGSLGAIDFQDAVIGAVTYDLVSLLKDCYIRWPRSQVVAWAEQFRQQWLQLQPDQHVSAETWLRWFDLMGLQRHIKVVGIFCRLALRDGKTGYLADIPRTWDYLYEAAGLYPELASFHEWLDQRVRPLMQAKGLLP